MVTGYLGVKNTVLETKTPFLVLGQTESEKKLQTPQQICDLEALWEHPVPSTSGIISVGNTNPFSAHGHVWVILDIFCDTSWTAFGQESKFENTSERETSFTDRNHES